MAVRGRFDRLQYVTCANGVCACKYNLGFTGDATPESKCTCTSPKSVKWDETAPYCINYRDAVSYSHEQARNTILLNKVRTIYNSLIWPSPAMLIAQLISGNLTGGVWDEFDEHANGRVDPVGSFHDKDGVIEYFYGSVWTGTSQVREVNITKLMVQGSNVTVRAVLQFLNFDKYPGGNLIDSYILTQSGVFSFNEKNKVQSAELIIHNLGWALQGKFANQTKIRNNVCLYYMSYAKCNSTTDPLGYFDTFEDCVAFMNSKPNGTWDQNRDDTVLCIKDKLCQ